MKWELIREPKTPLYQSIMKLITQNIQNGLLLPGEKLPAERKLAVLLGVNRSTIARVMAELTAKGILNRRQGSGTVVSRDKWGVFNEPVVNWHELITVKEGEQNAQFIAKIKEKLSQEKTGIIDAYTGELSLELIPSFDLPQINWRDFIEADKYHDDLGYLPLRQAISDFVSREYDYHLPIEQVMVTSGGHQALFLLVQTLLNSGDAVAICKPSFLYSLNLFQTAGIRLFGVAMDREGMRLDALENEILKHRVKLVMLNPTFQNPTGITMSLARRKGLIKLCQAYKVPIIEDDAFGFLPFDDKKRLPPLKKLDAQNVIYIASLSKMMGSTTKIGWISAPPAVLKRLSAARSDLDLTLSVFPQVLAKFALEDTTFEQKLVALRAKIKARLNYFCEKLGKDFDCPCPAGGFYVWLKLPPELVTTKKLADLVETGILCLPAFIFGDKSPAIRLNIARLNFAELDILIEKLQKLRDISA
jgi:DNA-binding transcriptional MocR family regulator